MTADRIPKVSPQTRGFVISHSLIQSSVGLTAGALGLALVACGPADSATPAAAPEPARAVDIGEGQQDGPVDVEVDGGEEVVQVNFR